MSADIYPKYQLPSGNWTTDQEHADRLWAKHEAKQARPVADIAADTVQVVLTEQEITDLAAHMAMRLRQVEARLAAKHPKAARDGELAAMLNDLDAHITVLRGEQ